MLLMGQTYNQRKWQILNDMKVTRAFIKQCNESLKTLPELRDVLFKVIEVENQALKDQFKQLQELEKWRFAHDLPKNKVYGSDSVKKKRDSMTAEELEAYLDRMIELDEQIIALEQEWEKQQLEREYDEKKQLSDRQTATPA